MVQKLYVKRKLLLQSQVQKAILHSLLPDIILLGRKIQFYFFFFYSQFSLSLVVSIYEFIEKLKEGEEEEEEEGEEMKEKK